MNFFKKYIFHIIIFVVSFYIFFYHLDYTTLASFDEAWYGAIAKNIIKSNDWLNLSFNGKPYFDHPPMGFWLIALSYKFFGISEFSTRFPSAFLGIITSILILIIVEKLFKEKIIGLVSSLIMLTSVWYVLRVRSGNLDGFLVFFYVLNIYLILKTKEKFLYFPLLMLSFAGLMLTKTLVGLPLIILIFFYLSKELITFKKNWLFLILGIISFSILFLPWYVIQFKQYPNFYQYHFLNIGLRNKTFSSFLKLNLNQPLFYLHMGVRKWYYPWILSLMLIFLTGAFLKKQVLFLILWNFLILYPFLTSEKTELWHLIPVYVPMAILTAYGIFNFIKIFIKKIPFLRNIFENKLILLYFLPFLIISIIQFKNFYFEIFPKTKYIPDDVDISKRLNKYNKKIFLDDDFFPVAVFYSDKEVIPLFILGDDKKTLVKLFLSDENNFIVVTRNWAVNNLIEAKINYKLLERNNSYSILEKK